ncbi:MAG: ATP-dependent sacrificial sulfur transferase LarE [Angelakisella sp.]
MMVPQALRDYFTENTRLAVAFSGGVDSSYLLYAAKACGCRVKGYYVKSAFQPQFELDDARRLAEQLDIIIDILNIDILADRRIAENPADRCYYCKRAIFERILTAAAKDGFSSVADGTNASDSAGDRAGMRAIAEMKIASPLRLAGLTKAQIREYSKSAELFTWDKPAYACLATRIPTGRVIDCETLAKLERSEAALSALGFTDFRLRLCGDMAKLQLTAEQFPAAFMHKDEIYTALSECFSEAVLDLKPRIWGE